jgi:hypothetical protein
LFLWSASIAKKQIRGAARAAGILMRSVLLNRKGKHDQGRSVLARRKGKSGSGDHGPSKHRGILLRIRESLERRPTLSTFKSKLSNESHPHTHRRHGNSGLSTSFPGNISLPSLSDMQNHSCSRCEPWVLKKCVYSPKVSDQATHLVGGACTRQ